MLGIGDDAAVLDVPSDMQLVVTVDTMIEGVHFLPDVAAFDVGYKAVAVSFSDLAAMGAKPHSLTLSLTVPDVDHVWLQEFSSGIHTLTEQFSANLIGGDLCKGALSITLQAHGLVPRGKAVRRDLANVGDRIYVTGYLGSAGFAFQQIKNELSCAGEVEYSSLHRPSPRVLAGMLLRDRVSSMIDISDGLVTDLGHLTNLSNVGAVVDLEKIPLSDNMTKLPREIAWQLALTFGDDYELCFTASDLDIQGLNRRLDGSCQLTEIGYITEERRLHLLRSDGARKLLAFFYVWHYITTGNG